MRRTRARIDVPGLISAAEGLWYDLARWPSFVDGFGTVARLEGEWPRAGARLVWDSRRGGRGRVVERVVRHEPRAAQESEVEDEKLRGVQRVGFKAVDGGVRVTLELEYELKEPPFLGPLGDVLFVRRALRDSLARTLRRFRIELASDRESLR